MIDPNIRDHVAVVTLNNPPLNVVTVSLTAELSRLLDALAADPQVRALVLTAAGERAFCVGSDIKEFASFIGPGGRVLEQKMLAENAAYSKLAAFPKPTLAALNGHALGGGLELAVCCDLIVAHENARLGLPEVKLGVFPGAGGTFRVPRRIGEGRAKELMLLGEPIDAPTALAWGLVNRISANPLDEALALARRLAEFPVGALGLCKQAIAADEDQQIIERTLPLLEQAFESDEAQEGVRAFLAKEPPRFR